MITIPKRLGILRSESSDSFRGGTQVQDATLKRLMESYQIEVIEFNLDAPSPLLESGDWVYTQQEGGLNQNYRTFTEDLLNRRIKVFEKNVFALPSKYRPVHPNYFMLLMSQDGANRFKFRNMGQFSKDQTRTFVLSPNLLRDLGPKNSKRNPINLKNEITLLKIARPDERKWSDFELQFSKTLALAMPLQKFHLRLVGYPWEMSAVPDNLRVSIESYSDQVESIYLESDVYIHESRIGESYGNTLFEALYFNMPIILALSAKWDCGPLEYLENSAVIKTRKKIIDNPIESLCQAFELSMTTKQVNPGAANLFNQVLNGSYSAENSVRLLPSLSGALGQLYSTSQKLEEPFGMILSSTIFELARSGRRNFTPA